MDTVETIDYRGYTINVEVDLCPQNPWEQMDCNPPIFVSYDRGTQSYGISDSFPGLTRDEIKAHAGEIARQVGARSLLAFIEKHGESPLASYTDATEAINSAFRAYFENLCQTDRLEELAAIYNCKEGYAAYCGTTRGYTQSSWAEVLVVYTPEWCEKVGAKLPEKPSDLSHAVSLYGAYAWGDVFGYVILDPTGQETEDSCWGYYGGDHESSGLIEGARNAIDAEILWRAKARMAKVKELIRAHVPLPIRAKIIGSMPQ